jgi:hypothetical protein
MQPQNPYIENGHDPYSFIMNPAPPPKKRALGLDPFIMRIILVSGAAFALMAVVAVVLNATTGSKTNTADLTALAQTQNEIIRVAQVGNTTAVQQTTKNLAITTQYSLMTEQANVLAFLSRHGVSLKSKDLKLKQNAATDRQLASAKATSTFDLVFSQIMQQELQSYASTLKKLYSSSSTQKEKDLLSSDYSDVQLLISQIPYTQQSIQAAGQ